MLAHKSIYGIITSQHSFLLQYTPLLPTMFEDNLLGICDARPSIDKLKQFFQMVYQLDLQVEQEGDHIDTLMASLAFVQYSGGQTFFEMCLKLNALLPQVPKRGW